MAVTPEDLLEYALNRYSHESREAERRSILHGVYYSAMMKAKQFAEQKGCQFTSGLGVHSEVIDFYDKNNKMSVVANNLKQLKIWRHKSDYNLNADIPHRDTKSQIKTARKTFLKLVD